MAQTLIFSNYILVMKNNILSKRGEKEISNNMLNPEYTELDLFTEVLPGKK